MPRHQLRGGCRARGSGIQAPEKALHETAGQQRREHAFAGGVKGAHVERARVAQGRVGGARGERLVHVDEVQLDGAEQFLDRSRHVDRQGRRPAAAGRDDVDHLAHRDHTWAASVRPLEQALRAAARGAQRLARGAHLLLRARRGQHEDAMAAARELAGRAADIGVDLVVLRLPRIRGHVGDREAWLGH